jgi:PAS domain S-box-containing protein
VDVQRHRRPGGTVPGAQEPGATDAGERGAGAVVLNGALDCVITIDQRGVIVEFNPAAERTFGYRSSEVIGQLFIDVLIPQVYRDRCREQMEQYHASGRDTFTGRRLEVVGMRADGTRFPAELSIIKSASSHGPLFTGFLRDITRQKRREAARLPCATV